MEIWILFIILYCGTTLGQRMYRYILILSMNKIEYGNSTKKATIVIPSYNEDPENLIKCVKSCVNQSYKTRVIVVDDGSKVPIKSFLDKMNFPIEIIPHYKNLGKRAAQTTGINATKDEIIVTVDSDTILDKNAVSEIMKPFNDEKVGSVAGNVRIANADTNFLTKMIGARYYNAFLIERRSQGAVNSIVCNTGSLSAYRRSVILPHLEDYNNQYFLGKKQHYGDDRRLTAYCHMDKKEVVFCEEAVAHTFIPTKLGKLLTTLIRWKKSFWRETFLSYGYMWKNKFLTLEMLYSSVMPFASLAIRINLIILCLFNWTYIFYYLFIIFYMALMSSIFMFVERGKEAWWNIAYAYFHEIFVYWLSFTALIHLRDNGWNTR